MLFFKDLYASPAKSEASSVDLYDDLDMPLVTEEPSEHNTPPRDCLDLYEEILTEEGTAKEASLNDLTSEYEKCQKQMKELIKKLKEMQTQNTSLQTENQCLKKNISALIKTARVEITRKEEEINRLNQRFAPVNSRNRMLNPGPSMNKSKQSSSSVSAPSMSINKTSSQRDAAPSISINKTNRSREEVSSTSINKTTCSRESEGSVSKASCLSAIEPSVCKSKTRLSSIADKSVSKSKISCPSESDQLVNKIQPICQSEVLSKETIPSTVDNCGKSELKHQNTFKGSTCTYSPKSTAEKERCLVLEESRTSCILTPYVKLYKENIGSLQIQATDIDEKRNRKENDAEHNFKERDRQERKNEYRHIINSPASEKKNVELIKQKSSVASNSIKSECTNGNTNAKSGSAELDDRKSCTLSSWDKRSTKERMQLRDEPRSKDKSLKTYERSPNKKELKTYEKSKNTDHRNRETEREENEPRRSKRANSLQLHDESPYKSAKCELYTSRKNNDSTRREKHSSEYNKNSRTSDKTKSSSLKNEDKHSRTHKSNKSEREKRDDERKKSRANKDGSKHIRNDRKDYKEHTETEKNKQPLSSQQKNVGRTEEKCMNAESKTMVSCKKDSSDQNEVNMQRNLKLSFMETLNLTLSPVKNKSVSESDGNIKSFTVANGECGTSATQSTIETNPQKHESIANIEQDIISSHPLNNPTPPKPTTNAAVSIASTLAEIVALEKPISELCLSETVVDKPECLHKSQLTSTTIQTNATDSKTGLVAAEDFETGNSEELETRSSVAGSDLMELDSFIEIDKCSCSGSSSGKSDEENNVQTEPCQEDVNLPNRTHVFIDNSARSPIRNITETTKELSSETGIGSSSVSMLEDLNKENCQPEIKTDIDLGNNSLLSLDEVEEGEIVSEEECKPEEPPKISRSPKQRDSIEQAVVSRSPRACKREMVSLVKPNGILSPPRRSPSKNKKKIKMGSKVLKLPNNNNANNSKNGSCLDGILKIVQPCSVQDVLQMLRVIRKHIRKKYMKFKMQFTLRQFHSVIEAATSCFITLVKSLDWTAMCSSPDNLQNNLCKCLESRMKQLKKNGIVDRIFEQCLIDMKKRLWKFVEDQLDSLFDTLKAMLTKLCNKAKAECDTGEGSLKQMPDANTNRDVHVKTSKKCKSKNSNVKSSLSEITGLHKMLAQIEKPHETNIFKDKKHDAGNHVKKLSFSMEGEKEFTRIGCDSNSAGKNIIPKPKSSSNMSKLASEDLECPQNTSGLSFNLVSDDHMGVIFKSLLHEPDRLEEHASLEENMWICNTPEKLNPSRQKCETATSSIEDATPIKSLPQSASLWLLSPEHCSSFSTLPNPDVLDESCMLETPTSASSGKSIIDSEDRTKSYSSILMEDLAVSLTVPSPLKSDSHLSFLRPANAPESISEENISTYNEDGFLEGEDATEQDIHLTLDSDNSDSTCSLSNPNEHPSFQCHPSEPMQAVIMEKSNDHFIVKIRRAVSAASPASDCSSGEQVALASDWIQLENENVGHVVEITSSKEASPKEAKSSVHLTTEIDSQTEPRTEVSDLPKTSEVLDHSFVHVTNTECLKPLLTDCVNPPEITDSLPKLTDPFSSVTRTTLETTTATKLEPSGHVAKKTECIKSTARPTEIAVNDQLRTEQSTLSTATEDFGDGALSKNVKKRSLSFKDEPLAKRKNVDSLSHSESKRRSNSQVKKAHESTHMVKEKSSKKQKQYASEEVDPLSSSTTSPNSMSARNVVKKKGEVVVAWTREEDRTILLDCQKLGPTEKTFLSLSAKMSKHPYQIEERFRQLMKLFKKCRRSSS
ncbi:CASP8-associated protein 2-like [Discoglossus pictus]